MNHAWLVIGPPGPERRTVARGRAAQLVGATDERLEMALEGRHADIAEFLAPLRIDDVRRIAADLARAPLMGSGRAVLFGEMTESTREAQNALLRIVEEPPEGFFFVGEAGRESDLLPTLRSRFVAERLPRLSTAEVERRLRSEAPQAPDELLRAAARAGKGYWDPAREALAALTAVSGALLADDGAPDWHVRAAQAVESEGQTWLNGLAGVFAAQFEATADTRYLMAWQSVERTRAALVRNANSRLAAEVLFSELSELGVLRHGAGGGDPLSQRR